MSEFKPSKYQQAIFDFAKAGRGSATIDAVAGSGKTTTCIKTLDYVPKHEKTHMLAFNASIAGKLKQEVPAHVKASTFHSAGFGALMRKTGNRNYDIRGNKMSQIMGDLLSAKEMSKYGGFLNKLTNFAKSEGVGAIVPDEPSSYEYIIEHHDMVLEDENGGVSEEEAIGLAQKLLRASETWAQKGIIDFGDQLLLPVKYDMPMFKNDWLFVDEAQDQSPIRMALAKKMLRRGGHYVAVGDPHQSIYGFAGAKVTAMADAALEFGCVQLPLSVTYRVSKAVVEYVQQWVPHIEAFEGNLDGEVIKDPEFNIATLLPGDAVICRNTRPLIERAYQLIAQGIGCTVIGRDIGQGLIKLIEKMRCQDLDSLEAKLEAFKEKEVNKLKEKGRDNAAQSTDDKVSALLVIIENMDESANITDLIGQIDRMFSDTTGKGLVTLCTGHKSKGLEFENVVIADDWLLPSRYATNEWQLQQEENLRYVMYTRTKNKLVIA